MADIRRLKPFILKEEGGFVNEPTDLGGATNKGVTIGTYKEYRKKKRLPESTVEDLKRLSDDEWTDILKTDYWNRWTADQRQNQSTANILVDWLWISGVHAIKIPQSILEILADGIMGKNTITAYQPLAELFGRIKQDMISLTVSVRNALLTTNSKTVGETVSRISNSKNSNRCFQISSIDTGIAYCTPMERVNALALVNGEVTYATFIEHVNEFGIGESYLTTRETQAEKKRTP